MNMVTLAYAGLVSYLLINICYTQTTVRVKTKLGDMDGVEINSSGQTINLFLNIPFAMPPIGDLRFSKPVPANSWTGVYNATWYGPSCMQFRQGSDFIPNPTLSEDCLYLNIYVPNHFNPNANKSVMVWIYGGGFTTGEAQSYNSTNLALTGDVIVVTLNYRIGVFGFLSSGDSQLPGNYGLWDQLIAIKWVKDNIQQFGGNPNSITIFGESAGSISVSNLLIAPPSDGLFQRAIGESGSNVGPNPDIKGHIETIVSLARLLHCPVPTSGMCKTMECLRKTPAKQLLQVTSNPQSGFSFVPVIDGDVIPDYPERLLGNTSSKSFSLFSSRDILFGVNSAEGGLYLFPLQFVLHIDLTNGITTNEFCNKIVQYQVNISFAGNERIKKAACELYKVDNNVKAQARSAIDFLGDLNFVAPTVKLLNLHKSTSKATYQYLFSQQQQYTHPPLPSWFRGATHGDELGYVFGMLDWKPSILQGDQELANLMMTYWTNFAKFGNPNGLQTAGQTSSPQWPSYKDNASFMNFSHTSTLEHNLFKKRMDFWLKTVPTLGVKYNTALTSLFG